MRRKRRKPEKEARSLDHFCVSPKRHRRAIAGNRGKVFIGRLIEQRLKFRLGSDLTFLVSSAALKCPGIAASTFPYWLGDLYLGVP